ncbi:MAG: hypothetical protein K2X47_03010 [Bdellovibrionales bacterium]|nr:hypothetical protein [Bdellovibrionales bacterium]
MRSLEAKVWWLFLVVIFAGSSVCAEAKKWNWRLTTGVRGSGIALNHVIKNKVNTFRGEILFDGDVIKTATLSEKKFEKANQILFTWMKSTNSFDHTFSICRSPIRLSFSSKGRTSHKGFCPDLMTPPEMAEFELVQAQVRKVILTR